MDGARPAHCPPNQAANCSGVDLSGAVSLPNSAARARRIRPYTPRGPQGSAPARPTGDFLADTCPGDAGKTLSRSDADVCCQTVAMSGRTRRLWPFAAVGLIAVITVAGLAVAWRSPHRTDLEGFAGLVIPVAGVAVGWIAWVWRHKGSQGSEVVSGQELGRLTDLLAGAVGEEWTRVAGEQGLLEPEPIPVRWRRPAAPFTGPVAAAVASARFAPLPGLAAAGEQRLQAGQVSELHEVYGGLGSGRLVIAGGPGSGKSGAAVLLILAALQLPAQRPRASPARSAGAGDVHLARVGPQHSAGPGLAG